MPCKQPASDLFDTLCCAFHVLATCCLQVIAQRLSKLGTFKKAGAPGRLPAEVLIKRRKRGRNGEVSWEVVRARGHLDEVLEMCKGGCKLGECPATVGLCCADAVAVSV
jgi:hypothetical protein